MKLDIAIGPIPKRDARIALWLLRKYAYCNWSSYEPNGSTFALVRAGIDNPDIANGIIQWIQKRIVPYQSTHHASFCLARGLINHSRLEWSPTSWL